MRKEIIKIEVLFLTTISVMSFCTNVYSQNILYNGDFEIVSPANPNFPHGWYYAFIDPLPDVTVELDDQVKHQGNYSLKFNIIVGKSYEGFEVMSSTPDTLYPGGLYKISYWVKTKGAGVHSVAILALWGSGAIAEPLSGDNDWTYREAILAFPEDVNPNYPKGEFLWLWFSCDSCGEDGSAWYDDIIVEYLGTPPTAPKEGSLVANYDFENNQVVFNWEAATPKDNPIAYYLIKRVKKGADSPNICSNPSFEDPNYSNTFADSWQTFSWSSADQQSWTEEVSCTGGFSVTISSEAGGHGFISKGLFPPEGTRGFDVYLNTYIKTEEVEGGSGAFVDFQDWYSTNQGLYGTNDWTVDDAVMANVCPGTHSALMFGNYLDGRGGDYPDTKSTGQAWYDDISVVLFDSIGQTTGLSFTDTNIIPGETYYYTVRAVDNKGLFGYAQIDTVETAQSAIDNWNFLIPRKPELIGNYPNPFNPQTTIHYQLPVNGHVKLQVYDLSGRLVQALVDKNKPAGEYSITWNAENVSSGIYFYHLQAGKFISVKKCVKMK